MELNALTAISPVDGRYRKQVQHLADYFSEFALIKYRVWIEIDYFLFLGKKGFFPLTEKAAQQVKKISSAFNEADAAAIKEIEKTTNHDVKAVEYFIKEKLAATEAAEHKEWVHFGLTSQDVNNTAIPLCWKHFIENEWLPAIINTQQQLLHLSGLWQNVAMLAKTHGQPASPTTMGKEWMVFVERLRNQINLFSYIPNAAKFGGATGNFNAHHVAFPDFNWIDFSNEFVNEVLGLQRMQFTTQIEHYDNLSAQLDSIKRIHTILIDFCRDVWTYISMDYFKQKTKAGEVGSSAMPHKVNPIDFENAEGNLGMANAFLEHLSAKLPVSRLQRDLTDSTVLRNLGVPVAHSIIALKSIEKGLQKLILNEAKLLSDLENNWAVVAEAVQTILRRENYPNPYEALKALTRGNVNITEETMHAFIQNLTVNDSIKEELLAVRPENYTGIFPKIA
ncbi:MAG: adenylosuccinate lyase [Chitinophagaceae bacterium]